MRDFFLLTSKPTLFACNVAESDLAGLAAAKGGGGPAETHVAAVNEYGVSISGQKPL